MAAFRFAMAAAIIEYPYAYIALRFEKLITSADWIGSNFELLGAIVMIVLGMISWWNHRNPVKRNTTFIQSGFRRGVIISLLNPLAIPFWIGVTAYLKVQGWVKLESELSLHAYVMGVSLGTFALLMVVAQLASRLGENFSESRLIRLLPAIAFLTLGLYALARYLFA